MLKLLYSLWFLDYVLIAWMKLFLLWKGEEAKINDIHLQVFRGINFRYHSFLILTYTQILPNISIN